MKRKLFALTGNFRGEGINHEKQKFLADFEARPDPNGHGVAFSFRAQGECGTVFHSETSIIGNALDGRPALWVLSSNLPRVLEHKLRLITEVPGGVRATFGFGDPHDRASFREEIRIEFQYDQLQYSYAWGMPGGEFAERSGCRLIRA